MTEQKTNLRHGGNPSLRGRKIFTVELTGEEIQGLRELAASWGESLEQALRRIAVRGIDMELHLRHYDEREAAE
jgi:hypothetical protein